MLVSNILKNDLILSSEPNSTVEEEYIGSVDYTDKAEYSKSQETTDTSPSVTFEQITETTDTSPSVTFEQITETTDKSPSVTFEQITEEYDDIDKDQFRAWLKQKHAFSQNVERVCRKYGSTLRKKVSMKQFMYDSEHDLLFCRNAKVCILNI